jgi:hypothetical protein
MNTEGRKKELVKACKEGNVEGVKRILRIYSALLNEVNDPPPSDLPFLKISENHT